MKDLLVQLHQVLTTDSELTAILPAANIGAVVRQPTAQNVLEYGVDGDSLDHSGHRHLNLMFMCSTKAGAEVAYDVQKRLVALLTAKNLTPLPESGLAFRASQVRLSDSRVLSRNEWAFTLRIEFSLRLQDLSPRTQKQ